MVVGAYMVRNVVNQLLLLMKNASTALIEGINELTGGQEVQISRL